MSENKPRRSIYEIFSNPKLHNRQKKKFIEALYEIDGFDLPFLYSLLVEIEASGNLNIVHKDGRISGISFSDGYIVDVDIVDEESYLGQLLIRQGFVQPEDLNEILIMKSSKRIGERLIEANIISPHAFDLAMEEQMNIRLSKTIENGNIKVTFASHTVIKRIPYIDGERLLSFLNDWIVSKISMDWLKSHYGQWQDYVVVPGSKWSPDHPLFEVDLLSAQSNIAEEFLGGKTVGDILESCSEPALKALHLLFIKGLLIFGERRSSETMEARLTRLKNIQGQLQGKNLFERFMFMGGRRGAKDAEVHSVYDVFLKMIGSDAQDPSERAKELNAVLNGIRSLALEVYDVYSNKISREKYENEVESSNQQSLQDMQRRFEEARNFLRKGFFAKAFGLLKILDSSQVHLVGFRIYYAWAMLGNIASAADRRGAIRTIEFELMKVPPEEKNLALYSYVFGLYKRARGDIGTAARYFEKAIFLDPQFMEAKRDLNTLILREKNRPKDLMERDISEVMTSFFKRR